MTTADSAIACATETGADRWTEVTALENIPLLGARVVRTTHGDIALFRTTQQDIFALRDLCPHKGGPLSQGIVYGNHVACPLHNWNICLDDGQVAAPDKGCVERFAVKVENGVVYLRI